MQSQQKTDLKTVIEFLANKFPQSFSIKGAAKPLKIGIFNDIAAELTDEDPVSKTQVRHALRRYTNSWRYLEAVEKGGMRVDLVGADVEALTNEHIEHAKSQLAESKAKFDEKRKAAAKKDAPKRPAKSAKNPPKRKPKTEKAPQKEPEPAKELVSNEDFSAGTSVLVKLGMKPMAATIVEASKGEVSVQLSSGMVMKVSKDSIFKA
ncbi:RNA chaperone ProQ [Psychrosphaera haliotis]|uniref:RNA chaperone ProQ n=1 Tax=Psychrosphaera haliotis TaxID=555083 RepID=UPI0031D9635C